MALFSDGVAAKLSFPFHHQHNDYVFIEFAKNDSLKDLSMSRLSLQISAREGLFLQFSEEDGTDIVI